MFVLVVVSESVRLHPSKLRHDYFDAITDALHQKYCNKVVVNVGVVISVWDILMVDDPYVYQGEAHAFVKVQFRLIVFRPVVGEVMVGKIRSSNPDGICISIDFFEDIFVPKTCMQPGTDFDVGEQTWCWHFQESKLFMDKDEVIRFRILSESFVEQAPLQKDALMKREDPSAVQSEPQVQAEEPYRLLATVAEDGLGLVSWWRQ